MYNTYHPDARAINILPFLFHQYSLSLFLLNIFLLEHILLDNESNWDKNLLRGGNIQTHFIREERYTHSWFYLVIMHAF